MQVIYALCYLNKKKKGKNPSVAEETLFEAESFLYRGLT